MAALFAATYPERTDALILWDTFATPTRDGEDKPDGEHWLTFRRLALDALDHWEKGASLTRSRRPWPRTLISAADTASTSAPR